MVGVHRATMEERKTARPRYWPSERFMNDEGFICGDFPDNVRNKFQSGVVEYLLQLAAPVKNPEECKNLREDLAREFTSVTKNTLDTEIVYFEDYGKDAVSDLKWLQNIRSCFNATRDALDAGISDVEIEIRRLCAEQPALAVQPAATAEEAMAAALALAQREGKTEEMLALVQAVQTKASEKNKKPKQSCPSCPP